MKTHCNDVKTIIEYSNNIDDFYEDIDEHNPNTNAKYRLCLMIWLLMWLIKKDLIQ